MQPDLNVALFLKNDVGKSPGDFSEKSESGRRIKLPKYSFYFSNSKLAKMNGPVPFPSLERISSLT